MSSSRPAPRHGREAVLNAGQPTSSTQRGLDSGALLDAESLRDRLSNDRPVEERSRALVELHQGSTGTPAIDAAILLNRIEVDPDPQIRAGAVHAFARRDGSFIKC